VPPVAEPLRLSCIFRAKGVAASQLTESCKVRVGNGVSLLALRSLASSVP
jgi:hypothetical protein